MWEVQHVRTYAQAEAQARMLATATQTAPWLGDVLTSAPRRLRSFS